MGRTKGSPNNTEDVIKTVVYVAGIKPKYSSTRIKNYIEKHKEDLEKVLGIKIKKAPSARSIIDIIKKNSEAIKNIQTNTKNDKLKAPFSVGAVIEHRVTAESIPFILKVMQWQRNTLEPDIVTIRQARWISKLYLTVNKIFENDPNKEIKALFNISWLYAHREEAAELLKIPLDTTSEDMVYFDNPNADINDVKYWTYLE